MSDFKLFPLGRKWFNMDHQLVSLILFNTNDQYLTDTRDISIILPYFQIAGRIASACLFRRPFRTKKHKFRVINRMRW